LENILLGNSFNNVIIDIRGNMGGSDGYLQHFSIFTPTPIILSTRWKNLFSDEIEGFSKAFISGTKTSKSYDIYLLVDDNVFSSAETFAKLCKQTKFATIIRNTYTRRRWRIKPFKT